MQYVTYKSSAIPTTTMLTAVVSSLGQAWPILLEGTVVVTVSFLLLSILWTSYTNSQTGRKGVSFSNGHGLAPTLSSKEAAYFSDFKQFSSSSGQCPGTQRAELNGLKQTSRKHTVSYCEYFTAEKYCSLTNTEHSLQRQSSSPSSFHSPTHEFHSPSAIAACDLLLNTTHAGKTCCLFLVITATRVCFN